MTEIVRAIAIIVLLASLNYAFYAFGYSRGVDKTVQTYEEIERKAGITVQTTPITYRRLLEIAGKMHCWIFLNIGDEYKAYDECGLTDEENHVLGSRGTYCVETAEPPKEE